MVYCKIISVFVSALELAILFQWSSLMTVHTIPFHWLDKSPLTAPLRISQKFLNTLSSKLRISQILFLLANEKQNKIYIFYHLIHAFLAGEGGEWGMGAATLHSMWYFPGQGLNPHPLHWKHRILTTGPPVKSLLILYSIFKFFIGIGWFQINIFIF